MWRSSHQWCSMEKAFLNNFAIFTGKHLCWSLFSITLHHGFIPATFLKKRIQQRCFPVSVAKFLRTLILKNTCKILFFYTAQLLMILKLTILRNFFMILWTLTCDFCNHFNYGYKRRKNLFSCDCWRA